MTDMTYTDQQRKRIAAAVGRQRRAKKLDKEPAARAADVSSITWKRVEDGKSVRDGSLAKILDSLGLPSIDELLDDNSEAQPLALIPDEELAAEFLRRMRGARSGLDSETKPDAQTQGGQAQEAGSDDDSQRAFGGGERWFPPDAPGEGGAEEPDEGDEFGVGQVGGA